MVMEKKKIKKTMTNIISSKNRIANTRQNDTLFRTYGPKHTIFSEYS